jgi:hypothetical protein
MKRVKYGSKYKLIPCEVYTYISLKSSLILNLDCFNPFKHIEYSVGVIYLVVANLPRSERYKLENVIIVGTIPGPREPKKH